MRPTFLFIFIALLAPDMGVAQPVSPLPAWYVAAMQQVEEIASELERDRAALIADSNARAAGAIGRVLDQVRAAGVDQADAQAAIDSLAPYTTAPSPGGPYGGVPYGRSQASLRYDLSLRLFDMATELRLEKTALGRYGRADRRALGGDREWVQATLDALDLDLGLWRARRPSAAAVLAEFFAAAEAADASYVIGRVAAVRLERKGGGDVLDEELVGLQKAADDTATVLRARLIVAEVARDRLARLAERHLLQRFRFFNNIPVGLIGRLELDRVTFPEGLGRIEQAITRLEDAELAWAARAIDADTVIYAAVAQLLRELGKRVTEWNFGWRDALDLPLSDIERVDELVGQVVRQVLTLRAADVAAGAARKRETQTKRRAMERQTRTLTDQNRRLLEAGDRMGSDALTSVIQALNQQISSFVEQVATIDKETNDALSAIGALGSAIMQKVPGRGGLIAIVAEPSRELNLRARMGAADRAFQTGDPLALRLALGLPVRLRPALTTLPDEPLSRLEGTAEAGSGSQPVIIADGGLSAGPFKTWEDLMRSRIVLVSQDAGRLLAAAPPAAAPASDIAPPLQPRGPNDHASPIAGKWNVTYLDGALGWVRGEAEIEPYGRSAQVTLTHPKTNAAHKLVADEIRQEVDGTYVLVLRGQQPHLDARLGPPVRIGAGGDADRWLTDRADGGPLMSTPPIPPELTQLPVAAGATTLRVSFSGQRAVFMMPAAEPVVAELLTLRLRRINTRREYGYSDAFRIVEFGRDADSSLQGTWEQPVDPATRQPVGMQSRYRLLERDPANPNRARQVGVEIWWRKPTTKIFLYVKGVSRLFLVDKLYLDMPMVLAVAFLEPHADDDYPVSLTAGTRRLDLVAKPLDEERRLFQTDVFTVKPQ